MSVPAIKAAVRMSWILFLALMSSLVIYIVIAHVITASPGTPPMPELAANPHTHPLFIALSVASGVALLFALVVRTKLMPPRRRSEERSEECVRGIHRALSKLKVAQLLGWALCEAVAINGLILTILSRNTQLVDAFAGIGAIGMILQAPSRRLVEDVVDAAAPD
jgi:hypothetical protein